MHQEISWPTEKCALYELLASQAKALSDGCPPISALSNVASLLWEALPDINWAGFYIMEDGRLVLGPFQGKTACIRIPVGKGVCGTAVKENATQRVADVHAFPGHIACDCASRSEIVVPIHVNGEIWGVLDIDSPYVGRFTQEDQRGLEKIVTIIENCLER